jgi:MFS family permease
MLSERYEARQSPLVLGVIILVGSQIMLMEAPVYWLMILARVLQGVGSTMVWVVGLALMYAFSLTERKLTTYFLLAQDVMQLLMNSSQVSSRSAYHSAKLMKLMLSQGNSVLPCQVSRSGQWWPILSIDIVTIHLGCRVLIGPPVGGALYQRFGFRGPFVFGMIMAVMDLIARIVVIERKEALKWGVDPQMMPSRDTSDPVDQTISVTVPGEKGANEREGNIGEGVITGSTERGEAQVEVKAVSLWSVLGRLCRSPRAVNASALTLIYG